MRPSSERRLLRLAGGRLDPDEQIVACAPVWYSRPVRQAWLAARYRDQAVLTDQRFMLWESGWLTRRPRRRVLADRLVDLTVADVGHAGGRGAGRRLLLSHAAHPPLVIELGSDAASRAIADALLAPPPAVVVDVQL
jgi:hypothetical protein